MIRAFIAFDIEDIRIQNEIGKLQEYLIREGVKGTFPKLDQLHVTIKFLGEIPEGKIEPIKASLAEIKVPVIKTRLLRIDGFPSLFSPRVVVAILELVQELRDLYNEVERRMAKLHFPKESREYMPHITIARVKELSSWKKSLSLTLSNMYIDHEIVVREFKLKRSILTSQGPIYLDLATFKLIE
ncbi:MAG: RNA 2',3'-cyclic phosphodiesterase [Candidatus Geothermarchaeota archaeon]